MKIVLVKSSIYGSIPLGIPDGMSPIINRFIHTCPPLGIPYIAAVLLKEGFDVSIVDPDVYRKKNTDAAIVKILDQKPDVIGISVMSHTFLYGLELAQKLKMVTDIPIIVGGNHLMLYPHEVMTHKCFDIGVIGEGEIVFLKIARLLDKKGADYKKNLYEIPNIIFQSEGEIIRTERKEPVKDLDSLPFPARQLLQINKYCQPTLKKPFTIIVSTRGCPYRCTFCSRDSMERSYRVRSIEAVVEEIKYCIDEFNMKSFYFVDDTFTVDKKRVLSFCELIQKRGIKTEFSMRTRADCMDEEIVKALKNINCIQVSLGIESGDDVILKLLKKKISLEQVEKTVSLLVKYRIRAVGFLMVGHPEEKLESIQKTFRFVKKIQLDWCKANILTPYPGSELYYNLLKEKQIDDFWKKITIEGRVYKTPNISKYLSINELNDWRDKINAIPYFRKKTNLLKFEKITSFRDIFITAAWVYYYLAKKVKKTFRDFMN